MLLNLLPLLLMPNTPQTLKTEYPAPKITLNPARGKNLQRTMTLLKTSTPQKRNRVRVLVYGQSITEQKWWHEVAEFLKKSYPNADLTVENRAIGGFSANLLKRTAYADLYAYYPDLVIFHDYGGDDDYTEIVTELRKRTTAEILLLTDHLATGQQNDPHAAEWHDKHAHEFMPSLAAKTGAEVADIRENWRNYLKDNNLKVDQLLTDGVHLNDYGCFLMARLVENPLVYNPQFPKSSWQSLTKEFRVGKEARWKNGHLKIEFEGNRVLALSRPLKSGKIATAKVLIDGKSPSEISDLYTFTRVSTAYSSWFPGIMHVQHEKPLLIEDWTLKVTSVNDAGTEFKFEVTGSKTGADGVGDNKTRFVSKSGRVVILPEDWSIDFARDVSKKPMPAGFEFRWGVLPLFVDDYAAPPVTDPSREASVLLAQGLSNGKHTLELIQVGEGQVPLAGIRVYTPPLK